MELEAFLDRMCMGAGELDFRLARIEIAWRKQNLRIKSGETRLVVSEDPSAIKGLERVA